MSKQTFKTTSSTTSSSTPTAVNNSDSKYAKKRRATPNNNNDTTNTAGAAGSPDTEPPTTSSFKTQEPRMELSAQAALSKRAAKRSKDHFTDAFALYIIISNLPSFVTLFFLTAFFLATNSKKILSNILIFMFVPYKYFEHGKTLKKDNAESLGKLKNEETNNTDQEQQNVFITGVQNFFLVFLRKIFYADQQKSFLQLIGLLFGELALGCAIFYIRSTFYFFVERLLLAVVASSLIMTNPKSCLKLATTCLILHNFYIFLFNKVISYNPSHHFKTSDIYSFYSKISYPANGATSSFYMQLESFSKIVSLALAFHILYYELLITMNLWKDNTQLNSNSNDSKKKRKPHTSSRAVCNNHVIFNTDLVKNYKHQNIKIKTPVEYNSQTIISEKDFHKEDLNTENDMTGSSAAQNKTSNGSNSSNYANKKNKKYDQHINDFYEISVMSDNLRNYEVLKNNNFSFLKNKMVIKNMENFIYSIFNWNNKKKQLEQATLTTNETLLSDNKSTLSNGPDQGLQTTESKEHEILKRLLERAREDEMPPLWKIFTSYKIIRNEGKLLHLQKLNNSVFNDTEDVDCRSLVLYNPTNFQESDYHRFNWADIYNPDNNLNKKIDGIAVVIYRISETFVQFLIQQPESYTYDNDEMVILVNGVIWFRVKSEIHPLGELVTIQGLMASYIYDIQFVIRDHSINRDFLIGDSIIRTSIGNASSPLKKSSMPSSSSKPCDSFEFTHSNAPSNSSENVFGMEFSSNKNDNTSSSFSFSSTGFANNNDTSETSGFGNGEQENLVHDFSFPSFYHRRFASPIVTLKNSVLTTNWNIAEERNKLKKMKKDYSKRLQTLKNEEVTLSSKIEKIGQTHEEESARISSKIDNLKKTVHQLETITIPALGNDIVLGEQKLKEETKKYESQHQGIELQYNKVKFQEKTIKDEIDQLNSKLFSLKSKVSRIYSKNEEYVKCLHYMNNAYEVKCENGNKILEWLEEENSVYNEYVDYLKNQENELQVNVRILEQNILRMYDENQTMRKSLTRLSM